MLYLAVFTQEGVGGSSSQVFGHIATESAELGYGMVFDTSLQAWAASYAGQLALDDELAVLHIDGAEDRFDVNEDGRLTDLDAVAMASIIGTSAATDPANLIRLDFDASDVIDQGDLDVIDALLDNGLGSGVFGDADSDGDADCADYTTIVATFVASSVLGDADYEVTYDFDLDGDNDATDRDEIRRLLSPADMAAPFNVLDFTDVLAFNVAFGAMDPAADLAAPFGVFDFTDVLAFNTAFAAGCPN